MISTGEPDAANGSLLRNWKGSEEDGGSGGIDSRGSDLADEPNLNISRSVRELLLFCRDADGMISEW
jgi:hypothetical protein